MIELLIGSHIGMSGPDYFLGTVKNAVEFGENSFMFYTGAPQNNIRVALEKCKIQEGLSLLKESGLDPKNMIVHAPYIINLGNTLDENKFKYSVEILKNELNRTKQFGASILVLHPGASVGAERQIALEKVVAGLDLALENIDGVKIALETMAGKGSELGISFEELNFIIKKCKFSSKLGVCLDTCHIHDGGFDLKNFDEILDKFDQIIGLENLLVIHLNDSKNICGSHKDRHENIGFGFIGFDNLVSIAHNKRLESIPKILETPYINEKPPYKEEIIEIKTKKFDPELKNL